MKNKINFTDVITTIDWVVFVIIIFITLASIAYGHYLKKTQQYSEEESFLDLLVMGRQLTIPMFVATLVATWYGGIFGVTEIAFNSGLYNFITQGVFWYISYLIFAFFIVNKIEKYHAVTLPDLIGKMFGPKSAKLSAIFNFFNVLPIAYIISLGLFGQMLFGGELVSNMILGMLFVTAYSMLGGIRAVIFSDIVQFFVMCSGVLIVLVFSINKFGGSSFLYNSLPQSYFSPTGTNSVATTLVWGFIALSTLVDPNFYQRCFSAKNSATAKKGIIISTVIWIAFDICTTLGAMYARAVIPDTESSYAYMTYALQILPAGLRGLFLAGILATILSTLDSYLFIAGTTLAYDLSPKKFRGKIFVHHLGVGIVAILSIIMAVVFDGNIKLVWKTLGSYSASCLLLPVVIGYLRPGKISDNQFIFSSIIGIIATSVWASVDRFGIYANIDVLYAGIISTSLAIFSWPLLIKIIKYNTSRTNS